MLLGNYVDEKLSAEVYSIIDNVIELVIVSYLLKIVIYVYTIYLFICYDLIFSEKKI